MKHSVKRRNLDDSGGRGAGVSAVFAKDTLRCWLRSWKRFVSIAVITLLGVAVLTGIYAGCRDAFLAAGRFYDQQGLHDLQVLSTYGLTDDDATALRRIDGVQTVQPERSQTVTTLVDGTKKTVTMQEIGTEGLDQPYLQQGKLPNKAGEVAVTQQFLNDSGLKIGGTITVTPQDTSSSVISVAATETDDSNNADTVGVAANASASDAKSAANTDADAEQSPQFPTKLTITGVVLDPRDLNNPDGYSGMTSFRSTSSEDYTFFAPSDGVTGNIYTAISVAVTGASDLTRFPMPTMKPSKPWPTVSNIRYRPHARKPVVNRSSPARSANWTMPKTRPTSSWTKPRSRSTTTGPSWKPTKRHCKIAVPNWRTTGQPLPMANGSSPMDVRRLHRPVNRSRKVASR